MTFSFEIHDADPARWPPFTDGCPRCFFDGRLAPYATETEHDTLTAFYRHRRCGHQWTTRWSAAWDSTWRVA